MKNISILGAGAWGTALAIIANRAGATTTLWTRNSFVMDAIHASNRNAVYLPDIFLDPAIAVTNNLPLVCKADLLVVVVPSQHVRSLCIAMSDYLAPTVPILICAKGIERGSLALMSEVVASVLPGNPVAVLSGPNFAAEAARGQPTATTIACNDTALGEKIAFALGTALFRPYVQGDMVGVQVAGAVKNVIAIACGVARGRKMGENASAALITRGLNEIRRLTLAKGGRMESLMGLAGLGDMILTCSSATSRNTQLGMKLAEGETVEAALAQIGTAEGATTAESVVKLAALLQVEMPICQAVYDVLYSDAPVDHAIAGLLERPLAREE